MAPQSKGGQKLKKKTIKCYKRLIFEHPKNSLYVVILISKFQDDLQEFRWRSYYIF